MSYAMSNTSRPAFFDEACQQKMRTRATRRARRRYAQDRSWPFFITRVAEDAASRLMDVNTTFECALYLGHPAFVTAIEACLPVDKRPSQSHHATDMASLKVPESGYDAVISCLHLQSVNNVAATLAQIGRYLRPDGLFLASFFGGETLAGLRAAFYQADTMCLGGIMPHIFPFADHRQAAALLSQAGFILPVVDRDSFTIHYKALATLVSDIRDIGESNSLVSRHKAYLGRTYLTALERAFWNEGAERYVARFDILWLTGWRPV